jgi:hypothetical protein
MDSILIENENFWIIIDPKDGSTCEVHCAVSMHTDFDVWVCVWSVYSWDRYTQARLTYRSY